MYNKLVIRWDSGAPLQRYLLSYWLNIEAECSLPPVESRLPSSSCITHLLQFRTTSLHPPTNPHIYSDSSFSTRANRTNMGWLTY